jgi:P27 family predicted phage terminase small subunit
VPGVSNQTGGRSLRIFYVSSFHRKPLGGLTVPEPKPPEHLSKRSKAFWRRISARYELETEHFEVLRKALEASDRADEAAELLRSEGLTIVDRYGQVKAHPAAMVELQNRNAFLRFIEALKLGQDEPQGTSVPARELVRKRWNSA